MPRRSMAAAAALHGRYNAGAADTVLLDGRWRKIQEVTVAGAGHDTRIVLTVGRGASREQRSLPVGEVLVVTLDPRFPSWGSGTA